MVHISIGDIVCYLPEILLYIVPGFIFTAIFRFFTAMKLNGLFLWVESAAISFAGLSVLKATPAGNLPIWALCALDILVCVIIAPISAIAYKSKWFEWICGSFFRVAQRDSVLHASVDWRDGTIAFIQLKNSQDFYAGYVLYINNPEDPQQWICIDNPVKYNSDRELIWPAGGQEASIGHRMVFHLDDVESIEFV